MNTLNTILYHSIESIHFNNLKLYALTHNINIAKFSSADSCDQIEMAMIGTILNTNLSSLCSSSTLNHNMYNAIIADLLHLDISKYIHGSVYFGWADFLWISLGYNCSNASDICHSNGDSHGLFTDAMLLGLDIKQPLENLSKLNFRNTKDAIHALIDATLSSVDVIPNFNKYQTYQIMLGRQSGVDVSVYSNNKYDWKKMALIRLTLERGLDASALVRSDAYPEILEDIFVASICGLDCNNLDFNSYNRLQVQQLLEGLLLGVDVSVYSNPEYDNLQMEQIMLGLFFNLDVSVYLHSEYDGNKMKMLRYGIMLGYDMGKYVTTHLDSQQIEQIYLGIAAVVDVSVYANSKYSWEQMMYIRAGLEFNLDVSLYSNPKFNNYQMEQILTGLYKKLPAELYANPRLGSATMKNIAECLEKGLPITQYLNNKFTGGQLEEIASGLLANLDVSIYADTKFNTYQMREIRQALLDGYDATPLLEPALDAAVMRDMRLRMNNVDKDSIYLNYDYTFEQALEIQLGIQQGVPVSSYANPKNSASKMKQLRKRLLK